MPLPHLSSNMPLPHLSVLHFFPGVASNSTANSTYQSSPAYYYKFNRHKQFFDIPVLPILHDRDIFDFCNFEVYTPSGIRPLLDRYGIQANQTWAAMYTTTGPMVKVCNTDFDIWSSYRRSWPFIFVFYLQNAVRKICLGAYIVS